MVFCKSCGHEIDIDSVYCSFCGVKQPEFHKPQQADKQLGIQPINKNVEMESRPAQPLAVPLGLESTTNNQSLSPDNLLDDIDLIQISLRRPETVNISIFLQVAVIIYDLASIVSGMMTNTITGVQVFWVLLFSIWRGLLANSIFKRKRKARITYVVLAFLRMGLVAFTFSIDTNMTLVLKIELFFIFVFDLTASILLFSKKAINWFNANGENIL